MGKVKMEKQIELYRIKIEDRDREILRGIHEQGFLTVDQTLRSFFPTQNISAGYRRIAKLNGAGLIRRHRFVAIEGGALLTLTLNGKAIALESGRFLITGGDRLDLHTLRHSYFVNEMRLAFANIFKEAVYVPENALFEMHAGARPDGILIEKAQRFALELENTVKVKRVFIEKHRELQKQAHLNGVFYVATSEGIERSLLRMAATLENEKFKIFVTSLEKLKSSKPTVSVKNQWLSLENL